MPVIDGGRGLDHRAAAIVPPVAYGDLEGPHPGLALFRDDDCTEGPCAQERLQRCDRICEASPALLCGRVQPSRELCRQTDARDVEEQVAVDVTDVDPPCRAGDNHFGRFGQVQGYGQRARQVVCRSHRQNTHWQSGFQDPARSGIDRSIAASDDRQIEGSATPHDVGRHFGGGSVALDLDRYAGRSENAQCAPEWCIACARIRIEQQQRPARGNLVHEHALPYGSEMRNVELRGALFHQFPIHHAASAAKYLNCRSPSGRRRS